MNNKMNNETCQAITRLLQIMDELRLNCPWDKAQTMQSLRHLTIEEAYELSEAVLNANSAAIKTELGDLLLHIVFYAKIASEQQLYEFADIINALCDKLIARHPHVYADTAGAEINTVQKNWEKLKLNEEGRHSVLSGLPTALPALLKAYRMQNKVSGIGFDWQNSEQVLDKINEELQEFKLELARSDKDAMESEFGDILFSLVNYARFMGINPENALERTNTKFRQRFTCLENLLIADGYKLGELDMAIMEQYWQQAKTLMP